MQPGGNNLGSAPHETPLGRISKGIEFLENLSRHYRATGYPDLTELQGERYGLQKRFDNYVRSRLIFFSPTYRSDWGTWQYCRQSLSKTG